MTTVRWFKKEFYIQDTVRILNELGAPQHVKELTRRISRLRGRPVTRASAEGGLIKHLDRFGDKAKIAKYGPAIYALPSWENVLPPRK